MTTQTVQVVEKIASIHRSIFWAYEENGLSYPIVSVKRAAQRNPGHKFEVYEPTGDYNTAPVAGKQACSADVPEAIKRGLMVWNECDFAVQTLFHSLQKQLSGSLPGTRVQWLSVDIAPIFIFREPDAGADDPVPAHSAFFITLPGDGGEFVVDFTIEQFGYGRERWFLPFEEYKAMTCDGSWYIYEYEDRGVDLQNAFTDEHLRSQRVMRELCDEVDWVVVQQMAESDCAAFMKMTYRGMHEQHRPKKRAYA
ncbi:hypothetical protein P171DRAFT_438440 [Karstenula rhodostoma CBS 690.94]|uniref:Uncharacterized protein n=1 Tax=Karstenula rhodostoma CBS 690.94 TaxID=1392251 RepID=A0A9P4PUT2_9PLEO|nr:hypothetical protein P171DRAFT_438440 [Karstenula rhodostoma CBS 690.94]